MSFVLDTPTRPSIEDVEAIEAAGRERLALLAGMPEDHPSRAAIRAEVIAAWLPLARNLARRFLNRGENLDDLVQVATIGLINAVDRFDPARGVDFVGYAIPTIVGEIKRHFRDRTWDVRVPRRLQELRQHVAAARSLLTQELGREPTVADVADHLDVEQESVIEALEATYAYNACSLSTPIGGEDSGAELGDTLPDRADDFAAAELRLTLGPAIASLSPRDQRIITLRFYENMTQAQIAAEVGVSQMHVSRLLTKALAQLRDVLTAA